MRVVVTGATGNVGTSVVSALAADPNVTEIVGLARRAPDWDAPKTEFRAVDITRAPLADLFEGADAVVHLAWLIQPSRDATTLEAVNVHGSRLVFEAAAAAGVSALVHASSVGAYGPGPASGERVDESWPTDGIPSSFYARHKAQAERALDAIEAAAPDLRVVRLRPGLIFKREAASEIRRLFAGPLLPSALANPRLIPVLPLPRGLRVQAVHGAEEIKEDAEGFLAKFEGQRVLVEGYFQVTRLDEAYAPHGIELCSGDRERFPRFLELELPISGKVFERAVEHWVVVEAKVSAPRLLRRGGGRSASKSTSAAGCWWPTMSAMWSGA